MRWNYMPTLDISQHTRACTAGKRGQYQQADRPLFPADLQACGQDPRCSSTRGVQEYPTPEQGGRREPPSGICRASTCCSLDVSRKELPAGLTGRFGAARTPPKRPSYWRAHPKGFRTGMASDVLLATAHACAHSCLCDCPSLYIRCACAV